MQEVVEDVFESRGIELKDKPEITQLLLNGVAKTFEGLKEEIQDRVDDEYSIVDLYWDIILPEKSSLFDYESWAHDDEFARRYLVSELSLLKNLDEKPTIDDFLDGLSEKLRSTSVANFEQLYQDTMAFQIPDSGLEAELEERISRENGKKLTI